MRNPPSQRRDSRAFSAVCEELLGRGLNVRFRANGRSMQPNIMDEDALIVAPGTAAGSKRGEIALTHSSEGFRVHRIVANDQARPRQAITRGDAGLMNDPVAGESLGRVISIERGRKRIVASGSTAIVAHGLRRQAHRAWLGARRRAGAPFVAAFFLILFSVLAASPASAQSLSVTLAGAPSPIAPGGTITYTAVVTNSAFLATVTGPITVSMPDPATTTFVSAGKTSGAGTWNCNNTAGTLTCTDSGNLPPLFGNSATLSFVFTVNNTGATSTYTIPSTATADAANTSPVSANTSVVVQIL
ncbi:MAG TPA: hypothetical protein VJN69_15450, partial [Candidatus Acidoferrales bacterium]|nr:hypothetical protein [Candidatus Acidoferrales bacterium]